VLFGLMPELGHLDRRQTAFLAGLGSYPRDSGRTSRDRSTGRSRSRVKRALFVAAMAARRRHRNLTAFHERLRHNGKIKSVALTAVSLTPKTETNSARKKQSR